MSEDHDTRTTAPTLCDRLLMRAEDCDEFWTDGFDVGDVPRLCIELAELLREAAEALK
jgi:hypothetical protein